MPTIKLDVRHPVPSLNNLFDVGPWGRMKEKKETQIKVLDAIKRECVLQSVLTDLDKSTQTISVQSILSTAYDTLALFMTTGRKT